MSIFSAYSLRFEWGWGWSWVGLGRRYTQCAARKRTTRNGAKKNYCFWMTVRYLCASLTHIKSTWRSVCVGVQIHLYGHIEMCIKLNGQYFNFDAHTKQQPTPVLFFIKWKARRASTGWPKSIKPLPLSQPSPPPPPSSPLPSWEQTESK